MSGNTQLVSCALVFVLCATIIAQANSMVCQNGNIRLVGGINEREGRVVICFNNVWGTVCDDLWSNEDAKVVCRQLGHPTDAAVAINDAFFGGGVGPIYLNNVACVGNESKLTDCAHNGPYNCVHSDDDAGVKCRA